MPELRVVNLSAAAHLDASGFVFSRITLENDRVVVYFEATPQAKAKLNGFFTSFNKLKMAADGVQS